MNQKQTLQLQKMVAVPDFVWQTCQTKSGTATTGGKAQQEARAPPVWLARASTRRVRWCLRRQVYAWGWLAGASSR